MHWQTQPGQNKSHVHLAAGGPINPVRAEKQVTLEGRSLQMNYSVHNEGYAPIDFIWGTHPAFAIEPGCRLHIPSNSALVSQANPARLGQPNQRYPWPILETPQGRVDMSVVPSPGNHNAGHDVFNSKRVGMLLNIRIAKRRVRRIPRRVCPHLWLWLSYGGWRGDIWPPSNLGPVFPSTLSEAAAAGTNRVLAPGETFKASVRATLWHGPNGLADLHAQKGL